MKKKDLFAHKSKKWDENSKRVQGAKAIAKSIIENVPLNKNMHIVDFGAGTGLLGYHIAKYVKKITAIDNSPSMLEVFKEKSTFFDCETDFIELDLAEKEVPNHLLFDGIISSMTLHHIRDIEDIFFKFYHILSHNGFIALAELLKLARNKQCSSCNYN